MQEHSREAPLLTNNKSPITRQSRIPKDADILAFLLALNQACAAKEAAGEPITPPGLPLPVEEHGEFVTEDCIRV